MNSGSQFHTVKKNFRSDSWLFPKKGWGNDPVSHQFHACLSAKVSRAHIFMIIKRNITFFSILWTSCSIGLLWKPSVLVSHQTIPRARFPPKCLEVQTVELCRSVALRKGVAALHSFSTSKHEHYKQTKPIHVKKCKIPSMGFFSTFITCTYHEEMTLLKWLK